MGKFFSDLKIALGPDALKRVGRKVFEDDCFGLAGQLAYFTLFSLFPFLIFLVALVGLMVDDPVSPLNTLTETMGPFLPGDTLGLVKDFADSTLRGAGVGTLFLGALAALWSGSAASYALIKASNRAYGLRETRPSWKVWGISALMVLCFVFFVGILSLVVFSPGADSYLQRLTGVPDSFMTFLIILRWPVAFVALILTHSILFYLAPDTNLPFKWITPGSLTTTVFIVVASLILDFYIANLANYEQLYGSLKAVAVLMLWLYVTGFMVILGVEMNAGLAGMAEERKDNENIRPEDSAT